MFGADASLDHTQVIFILYISIPCRGSTLNHDRYIFLIQQNMRIIVHNLFIIKFINVDLGVLKSYHRISRMILISSLQLLKVTTEYKFSKYISPILYDYLYQKEICLINASAHV